MPNLPFEDREFTQLRIGDHKYEIASLPEYSIDMLKKRGVIALNKPKGPTSHQVSEYLQRVLKIKKAGHGGTLDPPVTGVLPIALDTATRVVQALLPAGKEYVCLMRIHADRSEDDIRNACKSMIGTITQLPPVKSAVKRVNRQREIYYLEVLEIRDREVLFVVGCQAGTYIRRLCEQIGGLMDTNANMQQLVRTKSGPFNDRQWVSLEDIEDSLTYLAQGDERLFRYCVRPVEEAVRHLPAIYVFEGVHGSVNNGVDVKVPGIAFVDSDLKEGQLVALKSLNSELLALGTSAMSADTISKSKKGIAFITKKVFS